MSPDAGEFTLASAGGSSRGAFLAFFAGLENFEKIDGESGDTSCVVEGEAGFARTLVLASDDDCNGSGDARAGTGGFTGGMGVFRGLLLYQVEGLDLAVTNPLLSWTPSLDVLLYGSFEDQLHGCRTMRIFTRRSTSNDAGEQSTID
jgi:hypothetical protein